jgi:TetR/AcrR family transcriptional regulator, regulator of cefoperazone and chloramphenicol sensitivity
LARRSYSSPVRARQAESTRAAILAAARREFGHLGYFETTIESVAASAGVSAPTVYANFRSKAGLLSELIRDAGGDADIRGLAARALTVADPRSRLAAAARVVRTIMEREAELLGVLADAGRGHAELAAAWRQLHDQQHSALRGALAGLSLRAGLDLDGAADMLVALASPESYQLLVGERGWTPDRWELWLGESAGRLLLTPAG